MNRKRFKIDNERVLSDLSLNKKSLNLQKNVKPCSKQHDVELRTYGELKEIHQRCREKEVSKKEELMQKHSMIEEKKRELATHQLQVMDLEENEGVYHMHPEEQHDVLDYTLESKKVQLKEVMADVDSMYDELIALKAEYEMTKIECANQITCARDMKLDAKGKLENVEKRIRDKKSDLESLTTFKKAQKVYMDDLNTTNFALFLKIPLEYQFCSENRSLDPNQPREAQIEASLGKLKEFCKSKVDDAKAAFEKGLEEEKLWQEASEKEMEEVAPKTTREWKMEDPTYPKTFPYSSKIRKFQESTMDRLDMGNMNWKKADTFYEKFPDQNKYGITVHLTANKLNPRVTLVKNEYEIREPSPNAIVV